MSDDDFVKDILGAKPVGKVQWIAPPVELPHTLRVALYGDEGIELEFYAAAAFLVYL